MMEDFLFESQHQDLSFTVSGGISTHRPQLCFYFTTSLVLCLPSSFSSSYLCLFSFHTPHFSVILVCWCLNRVQGDNCDMTHIHHCAIIHKNFISLKILQTSINIYWWLLWTIARILPFSEGHKVRVKQKVKIQVDLITCSSVSSISFHDLIAWGFYG